MPHLTFIACDTTRQIQKIHIHAEITLSKETYNSPRAAQKLDELAEKVEALLSEYFTNVYTENFSNHEWNVINKL